VPGSVFSPESVPSSTVIFPLSRPKSVTRASLEFSPSDSLVPHPRRAACGTSSFKQRPFLRPLFPSFFPQPLFTAFHSPTATHPFLAPCPRWPVWPSLPTFLPFLSPGQNLPLLCSASSVSFLGLETWSREYTLLHFCISVPFSYSLGAAPPFRHTTVSSPILASDRISDSSFQLPSAYISAPQYYSWKALFQS